MATKGSRRTTRPTRQTAPRTATDFAGRLDVQIKPFGPTQADIDALLARVLRVPAVAKAVGRARVRVLGTRLLEDEPQAKTTRPPAPARGVRTTVYDYSGNRTLFLDWRLDSPTRVEVTESALQPLPSSEEFAEAVKIVARDEQLGAALRERKLIPYRPMPPLIDIEASTGRVERTVAVGLLPARGERGHEIVGVNMIRRSVIRFPGNAPATAQAHNPICGLPDAGQSTASGAAGQVWVTVKQGPTTLWKFLLVRPAASSGTNGSGVELRFVDYRGKRVLYRAHVPILNVKYDGDACGPYRDWQNQEGMLQAPLLLDPVPWLRLCSAPATTILDSGSDTGNFLGTAIYVQGQEVVLVSELEAGWYRYISQWRLHTNGTINARFGFSAVSSSCVCTRHHHHAYWRLDFDIRTAGNNRVREFNDPPLVGPSKWHTKEFEIRRPRDPARNRKWRVVNVATGEGYEVIPGHDDGVATSAPDWPFPKSDVWILRYRGTEIDDGSVATGPPYEAQLDGFVNGEPINGQDVVIWYGAHFTHDIAAEPPGSHGHIVGPTLKPVGW